MWKEAEQFLLKDEYIGPLIKKYGSCQIKPKVKSQYYEALVSEIIGQQLSGKVADTISNRLEKITNHRISAKEILLLEDQSLRDCGMAWAKVRSIKDLSLKIVHKELDIQFLNNYDDEEVTRKLITVKGIGQWTAQMFLMFTLARPDVFPFGDLGIKKGIKKLLNKELTTEAMVKFSTRWKPYRTVASWYIWRNLDNRD